MTTTLTPGLTERQWQDGYNYALILAREFTAKLPPWVDRAGFESAALYALLGVARAYDPQRGALSTVLHRACENMFLREWQAQQNWHRGAAPTSRLRRDPVSPLSLDHEISEAPGKRTRFADVLPDERYDPERACLEPEAGRFSAEAEAALARLKPEQAEIVRWRFRDELTFEEIGRRLGCSKQAARTRLYRALHRLQERWG